MHLMPTIRCSIKALWNINTIQIDSKSVINFGPTIDSHLKVMDYFGFWNFDSSFVEDFRLYLSVLKKWDLGQKWKIAMLESLIFEIWGNLQNYKFLEDCIKIPFFIDTKNSRLDRKHPYEWCRKEIVWNGVEMRKKWIVQKVHHPM